MHILFVRLLLFIYYLSMNEVNRYIKIHSIRRDTLKWCLEKKSVEAKYEIYIHPLTDTPGSIWFCAFFCFCFCFLFVFLFVFCIKMLVWTVNSIFQTDLNNTRITWLDKFIALLEIKTDEPMFYYRTHLLLGRVSLVLCRSTNYDNGQILVYVTIICQGIFMRWKQEHFMNMKFHHFCIFPGFVWKPHYVFNFTIAK